jgi:MobA/MobL family
MALYHVHAGIISKGQHPGGSAGFAAYLAREQDQAGQRYARYLGREGYGKEDLVDTGNQALPSWARSGAHFFAMADRYERGGQDRKGTVARVYEIALPRELSPQARLELAADIRASFFAQYPHVWAVHNPIDPVKGEQPHLHLMLSERRTQDTLARGPKQFFQQAAGPRQDPATHGVRKDRSWHGEARLHELRAAIATLTNAALEREGHAVAVSHLTLQERGISRAASGYMTDQDRVRVEAERAILRRDYYPWETELNRAAWHLQKQQEGIRDIGREAILDHVRDRFWQQDQSPEREAEREASLLRAIAREWARTGRQPGQEHVTWQDRQRQRQPQRSQGLRGGLEDQAYGGVQVHLAREYERGVTR